MRIRTILLLSLAAAAVSVAARADEPASETDDAEPFITLRASDLTRWCSRDMDCVGLIANAFYNRVDGVLFYVGVQYGSESKLHPRLTALSGWQSARSGTCYEIDVEQPLFGQDSFSFGVSLYDRTGWSWQDADNITDVENNLLAILLRQEQRDYYREDGFTLFAEQKVGPDLGFRLEYRDVDLSSLVARDDVWSAFQQDHEWRENPPLEVGALDAADPFEGRMKSYLASFTYDTREGLERRGWYARGEAEYSGESVGGDYEFRTVWVDVRRKLGLTDTQSLALRGAWGVGSGTDFPSHKLYYLGGLGTLRGREYRAFEGKNLFFASAEYGVRVLTALELVYFIDSGEVWYNTTGFDWNDLSSDMGIGIRFEAPGVGDVRVDVARPMTMEEADTRVSLRLVFPS